MNASPQVILWIIGAAIGVGMNLYMIRESVLDLIEATDRAERWQAIGEIVQWGFGGAVKTIGLGLGLWALALPPSPTIPASYWEAQGYSEQTQLAAQHGRTIFAYGLLLMMYGMDIRDALLIFIRHIRRQAARAYLRAKGGMANA